MENLSVAIKELETNYTNNDSFAIRHDFFHEVFSYESLTTSTILIYGFGLIVGIFGPISIIWYERNCSNRFRTILNQLFATSAWYMLVCTICVLIPEGIRFFYGPYGKMFCDVHVILKNILWSGVLLTLDIILILRYLFIFSLKNFAVINDDALARIFNFAVLFISVWASCVKRVTPGRLPLNYYLCCGTDPDEDGYSPTTPQKYNTGRIVVTLSVILHMILIPRIVYYQLVTVRYQKPLQLGILDNEVHKEIANIQQTSQKKKTNVESLNKNRTIFDLFTQITFIVSFIIIGVTIKISEGVEPEMYNLPEYKYIPLTIQLYGPIMGYIAVHVMLFTRNGTMRQFLWRKLPLIFRRHRIGRIE